MGGPYQNNEEPGYYGSSTTAEDYLDQQNAEQPGGFQSLKAGETGNQYLDWALWIGEKVTEMFDRRAARKAEDRARQYALEDEARQRKYAIEDRDYQNWWNSQAQQRKRMIAAGLNPALMYGGGGSPQPAAVVRSTPINGSVPMATKAMLPTIQYTQSMQRLALANANEDVKSKVLANRLTELEWSKQMEARGHRVEENIQYQPGFPNPLLEEAKAKQLSNNITEKSSQAQITSMISKAIQDEIDAAYKQYADEKGILKANTEAESKALKKNLEILEYSKEKMRSEAFIAKMNARLAGMGIYPGDPLYVRKAMEVINFLWEESAE